MAKEVGLVFSLHFGVKTRKNLFDTKNLQTDSTNMDQSLFEAVHKGDLDAVKAALSNGADANARDEKVHGARPMILAALSGNTAVMHELMSAGADLNCKDDKGGSPLLMCAKVGMKPSIEFLLQNGANVNDIDSEGCTCLHSAAFFGDLKVVELLLANSADAEVIDAKGNTPLLVCARNLNGIPPPPLPENAPAPPGSAEFDEAKWEAFLKEEDQKHGKGEGKGGKGAGGKGGEPPKDMPAPPGHPDHDEEKFKAWIAKMDEVWC